MRGKNIKMTQIAGWKTIDDWRTFRPSLIVGSSPLTWQVAYKEYFLTRLDLRYFNPIRILQKHGTFQGEGFSILAIQCTLIEFLESTVQGISYRYLRRGETLGPYEYNSSQEVFVSFLCKRNPFAKEFDEPIARDFYSGVRCGLLHEARTKNGWTVWANSPDSTLINRKELIVYRNDFQQALDDFIKWYRVAIQSDMAIQEAFVRKFDNLCQ
jgi:hypothetical protein